jgi:hypothetical protein
MAQHFAGISDAIKATHANIGSIRQKAEAREELKQASALP